MSLLVPVAAWPSPPVHSIRRILVTSLERTALATGSDSGQVCLWCVEAAAAEGGADDGLRLSPRVILLGHTAEISWLACCAFERSDALVSVCRSGFLNVWDPMDGRCLSSTSGPVLGGAAATQGAMFPQHTHAVIGGESLQLCVVELSTMTVRCVLADCQNWTHALATCSMGEGRVRLLSLEVGGELRSWDLSVQGAQVDAVPRGATRAWPASPVAPPPLIRQCEINADAGLMLTILYDGTLEVMALEPASVDGSAGDGGSTAADGSGGAGERMVLRVRLRSRGAWQGAAILRTAGCQAVAAWRESGPPDVLMLPAADAEPLELGEAAPAGESGAPTDGEARSEAADDEARDETPAVASAGATLDPLAGLAPPSRGGAAQPDGTAAVDVRAQCGVGVVSRWLMRLGHPTLEGAPGNVAVVGDAAGQLHLYQLPSRSEGAMAALGSTSIGATWPTPPASSPRVTASTMVAHEGVPVCLLLGHADGSLCAVDLPGGRSPEWMRGRHAAEVTALLALRSHGGNGRRGHFVSAAADGTVLVWRHRELQPLASFREHCSGVRALLQAPPGVAPHMAHYFLSVSHDNTIALFEVGEPPAHTSPHPQRRRNPHTSPDLDVLRGGVAPPRALSPEAARRSVAGGLGGEARCMGLLAGHAEPVLEVLWRPAEELLCCHCAPLAPGGEALLYVWQLSSGRLERVLRGAEAQPHLATMSRAPLCQTVPETTPPRELRSTASKRLLENVRLSLGASNAPLSVVIFNVKRLAAEAKKGAQEREEEFLARSSPSRERRQYSFGAGDADATTEGEASGGGTLLPGEAAFLVEVDGNDAAGAPADGADDKRRLELDKGGAAALTGEVQISSQLPPPQVPHDPAESPPAPPDVAACQSALSYMTCWGVDAAFDRQCNGDIGLRSPLPQVTYGVRGHGGHFSFLTPRGQAGTAAHHRWQCSAHLTALHSIAAVSLSNTLMMCPGHDEVRNVCSSLVTHFSVVLPEKLPLFCAPSLSLLARHYVDAVEEVQQAARALMEGTLQRMSNEVRQQIVNAWAPRVLRLGRGGASPDLTSPQGVSLLVLAVLASRFAVGLEPDVSSVLVTHLLQLLSSPSELTRVAAAELLGKGYATWRPHLADPTVLIKQLFRLSADQAAQQSAAATGSQAQAQAASGKAGAAGAPSAAASLPNRYHAALLSVAVVEPRAFCQAMGEQAVLMGGVASARVAAVTALISLVKARGVSLEEELPAVVEAVIKPLDPSVPSLREGCLSASTSALRELVKRYPMMAFNQGTQRLAVGTVDGVVLIYDLRTATKWRILQGHEAAISALAFSPGGESVASISALDGTLRWWQAGSSGLFSFLGLQGSCIHVTHVKEVAGQALPQPALLQLEWTSASQVMLSCNKQTLGFYSPKA